MRLIDTSDVVSPLFALTVPSAFVLSALILIGLVGLCLLTAIFVLGRRE